MKSKSNVRFFSRLSHLEADCEMADVFRISITSGSLSTTNAQYMFNAISPIKHPVLSQRKNTSHNRDLAATHLKATLYGSFIKDIYEDFTNYLHEIITCAAINGLDPNRLIGEHKVSIEANEILAAGNWIKVVQKVSDSVYRKLENEKSTKELIMKINTKLNLNIPQTLIDAALPYLEIRHLLIHADGKADQHFVSSFPSFGCIVGKKIDIDYLFVKNAVNIISNLVNEFDNQVIANNIICTSDQQP